MNLRSSTSGFLPPINPHSTRSEAQNLKKQDGKTSLGALHIEASVSTDEEGDMLELPELPLWNDRRLSEICKLQKRSQTATLRKKFLESRSHTMSLQESLPDHQYSSRSPIRSAACRSASFRTSRLNQSAPESVPRRPQTTGHSLLKKTSADHNLSDGDEKARLSPTRDALFKQVFRENIPSRPSYVFKIKCEPKILDPLTKKVSFSSPMFYKQQQNKTRYYFINPDWDSEKLTVQRICRQGKQDSLKYGWM